VTAIGSPLQRGQRSDVDLLARTGTMTDCGRCAEQASARTTRTTAADQDWQTMIDRRSGMTDVAIMNRLSDGAKISDWPRYPPAVNFGPCDTTTEYHTFNVPSRMACSL